ncbi:MAG: peptidase S8 [Sphingomonas sp. 28-66-16]|nr:MAG: peptidase S8 [Sphingomonas sp. 28-66-16]
MTTRSFRVSAWRGTSVIALMLVTGCSSGGGGGVQMISTPAPAPTPTPVPAPTPTPTPPPSINYDTAEYRATVGAVSANALAAYQRGATGAGVKVGVIDSGIDLQSAEFGNRIDPASADFAGNGSIDDEGGHGTAVAFTLAGRRNDTGSHGVAFDATLLVLRTDNPGSCATTGTNGGCTHNDANIARALDVATTNGARVVNISLGGSGASAPLVQAINRATAAGVIVVLSAGNDASAQPDPLAQIAQNDAVARGLVIVAGSVGSTDGISDFSDRAGSGANYYLTAVGERVRAPDNNDVPFLWSGTSFAAPQISGAIALLAQAFPNLTGAQIVDILYRSARDAGAVGVDPVYGRGILDLTRAFAPLGATSLASTGAAVSLTSNGQLSAPMGDAVQTGLGAVILDGYGRAFGIELARTLQSSGPDRPLTAALDGSQHHYSLATGDTAIAVTIASSGSETRIERTLLSPGNADRARTIAATIAGRIGSKASFAIGLAQTAGMLGAQLAGRRDPAFLIARDPAQAQGFASTPAASVAIRRAIGAWGMTVTGEHGAVLSAGTSDLAALRGRADRFGYDRLSIGVDRQLGPLIARVTATYLDESNTLLGAHFGAGLGAARATSWFVDAGARIEAGGGWSVGGSVRQGWTLAAVRAVTGSGLVRTNGFAADLGKDRVFGARDSFGLRIAQPLRVAAGGIDLALPTNYDYATGGVSDVTRQRLNLTPTGREIDIEARYGFPLAGGALQTHLFWRRDPGNIAALADDVGAAVRFSIGF